MKQPQNISEAKKIDRLGPWTRTLLRDSRNYRFDNIPKERLLFALEYELQREVYWKARLSCSNQQADDGNVDADKGSKPALPPSYLERFDPEVRLDIGLFEPVLIPQRLKPSALALLHGDEPNSAGPSAEEYKWPQNTFVSPESGPRILVRIDPFQVLQCFLNGDREEIVTALCAVCNLGEPPRRTGRNKVGPWRKLKRPLDLRFGAIESLNNLGFSRLVKAGVEETEAWTKVFGRPSDGESDGGWKRKVRRAGKEVLLNLEEIEIYLRNPPFWTAWRIADKFGRQACPS